jgi:hypothetical protein
VKVKVNFDVVNVTFALIIGYCVFIAAAYIWLEIYERKQGGRRQKPT